MPTFTVAPDTPVPTMQERGRGGDEQGVEYPDSDGEPMADNNIQFEWIVTIKENLEAIFADRADVFVAGDHLWYPLRGDVETRVAPDIYVAFGRPKGYRGSYRQWNEMDVAPQVVFEILSPGTRFSDMMEKQVFYDRFAVEEYYVYYPEAFDLTIWGRDDEGQFVLIKPTEPFVSPRLGVRFETAPDLPLRLFTPGGDLFQTFGALYAERAEAVRDRDQAVEERDAAVARAEQLAARLRELGVEE